MKGKIAATALVLLLLTFGSEAELCKRRSLFEECINNAACAASCIAGPGGYTGGYCSAGTSGSARALRTAQVETVEELNPQRWRHNRRCTCTKDCTGGGGGGGGGGDGDSGGAKAPAPKDDSGSRKDEQMALIARARRAGGHA